jgi:DNA invertase Pin-like site-specific DNA recombinase
MAKAQKQGWALVALDCAVDTTTPAGEAMANVLAVFAQFERRLISQRTRKAPAVKRSQGVRLGRLPSLDARTVSRIRRERKRGKTLAAFAEGLAATVRGRRWQSRPRALVNAPRNAREEKALRETRLLADLDLLQRPGPEPHPAFCGGVPARLVLSTRWACRSRCSRRPSGS